jgi:hypothetical protein
MCPSQNNQASHHHDYTFILTHVPCKELEDEANELHFR